MTKFAPSRLFLLGLLITFPALLLALGCSPGKADVSGTVMYNGKPVAGGNVVFLPEDGGKGGGSATVDKEGNFSLTNTSPGKMKVYITVPEKPKGAPGGAPKMMPDDKKKDMKKGPDASKLPPGVDPKMFDPNAVDQNSFVEIPKRYKDVGTSGLTFEIKPGKNTFAIELKD
jgi:hypothetical protein